jgi:acetyl esterase
MQIRPAAVNARLERALGRLILELPAPVKRRIAGAPVQRDGLPLELDTQVLLKLGERNPRPPLRGLTPAQARADLSYSVAQVEGPQIPLAGVRELAVAGGAGELRARLYTPPADPGDQRPVPLVVYFHGGGWVVGDLETHDQPCRLLALHSGAKVLSVDYRLAPEDPFPAAVDDALASFRDAIARSAELGIDPARVAVAGDSAGGHLAAVCSLLAAADGGPAPAFQLLIYPATDFVEIAPSRLTFAEGFLLTKENMDWYEEQFLGPQADRHDPRISPLRAPDLAGVAPAMVVTAGFDPLRDEGEAYAARLREAGVPCALRRHPGSVHGFIHILVAGTTARGALAEMGGALRGALSS